ncbi:uncharacterized protein EAE98_003451 [Botrytis deweyae]|uniref:Uncharacterized protein n=1 Tax=Botrytis deweyae TaxID=2478750 RepID=A0ABQ7ITJ7_9HELO|nr:uncharacterized protein EAE98_003451 [Botrytis deweyae]KAF7933742.1 hypothetical protein EAE98_003451 [Botrytis deweyae]
MGFDEAKDSDAGQSCVEEWVLKSGALPCPRHRRPVVHRKLVGIDEKFWESVRVMKWRRASFHVTIWMLGMYIGPDETANPSTFIIGQVETETTCYSYILCLLALIPGMRHAGVHRSGHNSQDDDNDDDDDDAVIVVVGIVRTVRTVYCEEPRRCGCVGLKFDVVYVLKREERRDAMWWVVRWSVKYFDVGTIYTHGLYFSSTVTCYIFAHQISYAEFYTSEMEMDRLLGCPTWDDIRWLDPFIYHFLVNP